MSAQRITVYGLSSRQWSQIFAAWGGWLMDGYTTIAYALVAVTISKIFFPNGAGLLGLIATFGGFAVEALARPFGSLVAGNFLGDKIGRKAMLTLTILGFSIFAASKGLLPTYAQVGVLSPLLLYIVLFIEGMFAGAEYGGGTALSMESVPAEKRGFIGAFVQSGFGTGYFIIAFVFAGLSSYFGPTGFAQLGWRILFFTTIIPGLLTLIIRLASYESPVFENMKSKQELARTPVMKLFGDSPSRVVYTLLITTGLLYINTATFSFYPAIMESRFSATLVGELVGIINLVSLFGIWFGGYISNTIGGRRRPMFLYALLFLITILPFTYFGYHGNSGLSATLFSAQAFVEAMIFATLPSFLAETFSKKYRATAIGFTYNGGAIVGGFAVSIIYATSVFTGLLGSWLLNLFIANVVMLVGIALSKETYVAGKDTIEA
jgi:MFS family permease